MGRISTSASRRDAAWRAAIVTGALLTASALPAAAQTMTSGGRTSPDVVVNESVIDSLGPPQTLPGLLRQPNAGSDAPSGLRPVSLHPPRAHRSAGAPTPSEEAQQTEPVARPTRTATAPTTMARSHRTQKTRPERTVAAAKPPKAPKQTAAK